MSDLDERLRAALTHLGDAAERQIRPTGSATARAAGRRRRRAARAATATLAVVLAVGAVAAWSLAQPPDRVATPRCEEADAVVYLPVGEDESRLLALLADAPEVEAGSVEPTPTPGDPTTVDDAYEQFKKLYEQDPAPDAWRFRLRCASDLPALRDRIRVIPRATVVCRCDQTAGPGQGSGSPSGAPGRSSESPRSDAPGRASQSPRSDAPSRTPESSPAG